MQKSSVFYMSQGLLPSLHLLLQRGADGLHVPNPICQAVQVPWGHLDCLRCPKPCPEVLTVLVRKQGCSGTCSTMYPSNSKTTCTSLQNTFQIERGKPYVVSRLSGGKQLSCGCHVLLINTQHSGLRNPPFRLHLQKAE